MLRKFRLRPAGRAFNALRVCAPLAAAHLGAGLASAADWNNNGGNAGRFGLTTELGPDSSSDVLWTGGRSSIIAWQPVIEGDRVFMIRQTGFPPSGEPNGSPVIAQDIDTGAELWRADVVFNTGDWTTWIAGVNDGVVYASRSGNGASVAARMHALDAMDGHELWVSQDTTRCGPYDGVVFAPDGDLIVGDFYNITRIDADDGHTVWRVARVGSVSSSCGVALHGDAVYAADAVSGGHAIKRFDLATGAFQYQSPVMSGFTLQNTPMVAPDGTIYLNRTQNNPSVDYFYALRDDGSAITIAWSVPSRWTTFSEFAVAGDGSVYMIAPGNVVQRRAAADGALIAASDPIVFETNATPRMAVDSGGRLFLSNGAFAQGRFYSFNADLTQRWVLNVTNINIGAPALGRDGTLLIAGVGNDVRAFRTERPSCPADLNDDGSIDLGDLSILLANFGAVGADPEDGDLDGDGDVDLGDLSELLVVFGTTCA